MATDVLELRIKKTPMAPPAASCSVGGVGNGNYLVVAWDLDTTGRRLIDEICHIGGYILDKNGNKSDSSALFSQYVMPYKNPNPGARRSFGIKVVSVGRYRMLKDMDTGKILKTKSEVSALQNFIDWLEEARKGSKKDGVLLARHEPNRKVLVPLLLEALQKYKLEETFNRTVKGFVNGVDLVESLGCEGSTITSYSLRSLCKTVLRDTNPDTNSASDRCQVLMQIISRVCGSSNGNQPAVDNVEGGDKPAAPIVGIDARKIVHVATSVQEELEELHKLKGMLDKQGTLRPIFEQLLKQRRSVRERAMTLRKLVAESGLDYDGLEAMFREHDDQDDVRLKGQLKSKISADATDQDVDELVALCKTHFSPPAAATVATSHSADGKDATTATKKSFAGSQNRTRPLTHNQRTGHNHYRKSFPKQQRSQPNDPERKPAEGNNNNSSPDGSASLDQQQPPAAAVAASASDKVDTTAS